MPERELVIVGGGPAGLTAGLYAARARLDVVLLEQMSPGGQVLNTHLVENWPGEVDGVGGYDLAQRMKDHAVKFGLPIETAEVTGLRVEGERKVVLARELSKVNEEVVHTTCEELAGTVKTQGVKGEITLLVAGGEPVARHLPDMDELLRQGLRQGAESPSRLARRVVEERRRRRALGRAEDELLRRFGEGVLVRAGVLPTLDRDPGRGHNEDES